MKTRNTILAALAAIGAVTAVAAPAAAQPARWANNGAYNLNQRQAQLDNRIEIAVRQGAVTRREATQLRTDSRDIARLEARYRSGGLTARERADLDRRFDLLDARVSREIHDRDYGQGYGHRR